MSLKPLYLASGHRWQVRLDGAALRVCGRARAPSRYPLRRLSRVVSATDVQWNTEALLGCLGAGVPVLFCDSGGRPKAWCFGPRRRETTLEGLLREGLSRMDWDDRFADWRRAAERREMMLALHDFGLVGQDLSAPTVRAGLCNAHQRRFGVGVAPHLGALRTAMAGLVARYMTDAIGDADLIAWARPGLHLGECFTDLTVWRGHIELQARGAFDLRCTTPGRLAAEILESAGSRFDATIGTLLGDFERWLREWLL